MDLILAGCGKLGSFLTAELSNEGHDIIIVDQRPERVTSLAGRCDVMGVTGNILDPSTLEELGLDGCDLFIAVTGSDEVNLLSCLLAKKAGCTKAIARVRNPQYADALPFLKEQLGLVMIVNPEELAAREIYRALHLPPSIDVDTFSRSQSEILRLAVRPGSPLCNLTVRDLPTKLGKGVLVCVVQRDGKAYIPDGDFVLQEKDLISIAGRGRDTTQFLKKAGFETHAIRSVMIVGAGKLTYYLARLLEKARISMIIIEKDLQAAETMANLIPSARVIAGDGSDQNLLLEQGIENVDAFISLTGMDEENIFLSLYAGCRGQVKTITKVNRIVFDEVMNKLDLDTIVNPKQITAETLIRYARMLANSKGSNVESIHKLAGEQVEALEFRVGPNSPVIGIPLSRLELKPGVLVALITRGHELILPRGSDVIRSGDLVVVVTTHTGFCDIHDILKKGSRS